MKCIECKGEAGLSLVCESCRRTMTNYKFKKATIAWHNEITEAAREGDMYRCFHCTMLFERNRVCGDHFPYSKARRPDLRFDLRNGQTSCMACNVTNARTRRAPTEEMFDNFRQVI